LFTARLPAATAHPILRAAHPQVVERSPWHRYSRRQFDGTLPHIQSPDEEHPMNTSEITDIRELTLDEQRDIEGGVLPGGCIDPVLQKILDSIVLP
jgi:hypothetical protein